jgi:hypothetical protein
MSWAFFGTLGGIVFSAGAVVLASTQYIATFRANRVAATWSTALLALAGFVSTALVLATFVSSGFVGGGPLPSAVILVALMAASTGVLCFYTAWLNEVWRASLPPFPARSPYGMQISLRELIGLLTVVGMTFGLVTAFVRGNPPRYAEHLEAVDPPFHIPRGAKDICFSQHWNDNRYEFTIDESGFRAWVEKQRAGKPDEDDIAEIRGMAEVPTYRGALRHERGVEYVRITDGLHWSSADEYAQSSYYFDRRRQRAYYWYLQD